MVAFLQKLAGKLRFAQAAAMGRHDKAALKPTYDLIAAGGGQFPTTVKHSIKWWEEKHPFIVPKVLMDSKLSDGPGPVRIYSDATGTLAGPA